jgi:hypothetical protein
MSLAQVLKFDTSKPKSFAVWVNMIRESIQKQTRHIAIP